MSYNDTPLASQNFSVTQDPIRQNFLQLDSSYGLDHFGFSNATANNGYHQKVTFPAAQSTYVVTNSTTNAVYPYKLTNNIGPLVYAVQPSGGNATGTNPTPISSMQSGFSGITVGAGASQSILDFSGVNTAIAILYAIGGNNIYLMTMINYFGSAFVTSPAITSNGILATTSGSILNIKNNTAGSVSLFWTLQFIRLQ